MAFTRRNAFRYNPALGIFANMNHFGSSVGLLHIVGDSYRIKLTDGVITFQDTEGYFQVIAEPVSTCVQEILAFGPSQIPRLVTKL